MVRLIRYLYATVWGDYIVSESVHYGQHIDHVRLGRFRSLTRAKAFASQMAKEMRSKVVVSSWHNWNKLYVYRPRDGEFA